MSFKQTTKNSLILLQLAFRFTKGSKPLRDYESWISFQAMETAKMISIAAWISGIVGACAMSGSLEWSLWVMFVGLILLYPASLLLFKTKPSSLPAAMAQLQVPLQAPRLNWSGFKNQEWLPLALFWATPAATTLTSALPWMESFNLPISSAALSLFWIVQAGVAGFMVWWIAKHADRLWRYKMAWQLWSNPSELWTLSANEPKKKAAFWARKAHELNIKPPVLSKDRFAACWKWGHTGNIMALEWALKSGFSMDEAGRLSEGLSRPIVAACQEKQTQTFKWFLDQGVSVKDSFKYTPEQDAMSLVCIAAAGGDEECLQLCLDHGGDPNATYGSRVALEWALAHGHIQCAWRLFNAGASVDKDIWMERGWDKASDIKGERARACLNAMQEKVLLDQLTQTQTQMPEQSRQQDQNQNLESLKVKKSLRL